MGKRIEVKQGDKYGRFTIVCEVEKRKSQRYFKCKCDCGNERIVRFVALNSGESKSCGCLRDEQNKTVNLKHGEYGTRLHSIWHSMLQRCLNPNSRAYKFYGKKGITVCEEWRKYEAFSAWAKANGYREDLTIDRIKSARNYEPQNCRWATMNEQSRNKSNSKLITFKNETLCESDWADRIGISRQSLSKRLKKLSIEEALTKPKKIQ